MTTGDDAWHTVSVDEALHRLDSSIDGLSDRRRHRPARRARTERARGQGIEEADRHPLGAAHRRDGGDPHRSSPAVARAGKFLEAGAIGAIVVLFALLGFFQEYRAEQAIAALRKMAVPTVRAVRSGRTVEVPAAELVPGDLVQLEAGSVVPADMRLIEAANLRIQEATLTGESEPVDKQIGPLDRPDLSLGDRRNMGYSGTQVTYGRGVGLITSTGMGTELGRIATLLQEVKADRTPLQHRLDRVGKQLALVGLIVAVLVVIMGAIAGETASNLVLTAISVAVAVIPEGLPAVVTFTLAIGAQRMLRRNSLIRKLPAVETLGSVTTICSDKTGTLTQNRMTVTVIDVANHQLELTNVLASDAVGSGPHRCASPSPQGCCATTATSVRRPTARPAPSVTPPRPRSSKRPTTPGSTSPASGLRCHGSARTRSTPTENG
jgi:P-type Ca2+ transporter type 2C